MFCKYDEQICNAQQMDFEFVQHTEIIISKLAKLMID